MTLFNAGVRFFFGGGFLSVAVLAKPAAASAGLSNRVNPRRWNTAGWRVDVRDGLEE